MGDIICDYGKLDKNIAQRRAKGFGIVVDIFAIPLGTHKFEAGLDMRNVMLINDIRTFGLDWN